MAFGFPPKYTSRINLNLRFDDAIDLVKETFQHLDWKYWLDKPSVFSGWGKPVSDFDRQPHLIMVKVDEYDGIEVRSQNVLPWPFFDFGENRQMVEAFIETLSIKSFDRPPRFSHMLPNDGRLAKTVVEKEND